MDKPFFVYRHIRLDNNQPFYVGIGKKPSKYNGHNTEYKRAYNTSHRNIYWKNIINKTDYRVEVLWESENLEEIQLKEIEFISLYGRKEDGGTLANMTSGGEFNSSEIGSFRKDYRHSEATCVKMSKNKRVNRPEVVDITTGIKYTCFKEACELLNLNFCKELDRVRYKSKKARIFKVKI